MSEHKKENLLKRWNSAHLLKKFYNKKLNSSKISTKSFSTNNLHTLHKNEGFDETDNGISSSLYALNLDSCTLTRNKHLNVSDDEVTYRRASTPNLRDTSSIKDTLSVTGSMVSCISESIPECEECDECGSDRDLKMNDIPNRTSYKVQRKFSSFTSLLDFKESNIAHFVQKRYEKVKSKSNSSHNEEDNLHCLEKSRDAKFKFGERENSVSFYNGHDSDKHNNPGKTNKSFFLISSNKNKTHKISEKLENQKNKSHIEKPFKKKSNLKSFIGKNGKPVMSKNSRDNGIILPFNQMMVLDSADTHLPEVITEINSQDYPNGQDIEDDSDKRNPSNKNGAMREGKLNQVLSDGFDTNYLAASEIENSSVKKKEKIKEELLENLREQLKNILPKPLEQGRRMLPNIRIGDSNYKNLREEGKKDSIMQSEYRETQFNHTLEVEMKKLKVQQINGLDTSSAGKPMLEEEILSEIQFLPPSFNHLPSSRFVTITSALTQTDTVSSEPSDIDSISSAKKVVKVSKDLDIFAKPESYKILIDRIADRSMRNKIYSEIVAKDYCRKITKRIVESLKNDFNISEKMLCNCYITRKSTVNTTQVTVKCVSNPIKDDFLMRAYDGEDFFLWITLFVQGCEDTHANT